MQPIRYLCIPQTAITQTPYGYPFGSLEANYK